MQEEDTIHPEITPTPATGKIRRDPCLVMISGKMVGRKYRLHEDRFIIGRGTESQIPIDEQTVSRRHAELMMRNHQVIIKDLKSKNGIFVNDVKVSASALKDGDIIRIGNTVFKFVARGRNESLYYSEAPVSIA